MFGVVVAAITFVLLKRKLRKGIVDELSNMMIDVTDKSIEVIETICPNCAHCVDGSICDTPDMQNICTYGACTRYEPRRF